MTSPRNDIKIIKQRISSGFYPAEALAKLAMHIRNSFPKMEMIFLFLVIFLLSSCNGCSKSSSHPSYIYKTGSDYNSSSLYNSSDIYEEESDEEENRRIDDGTYTADVEYYNPNTGYSSSYTLDVEVTDGYVEVINFPNGGWLDDSHIDPAELDEDGNCTIYDDGGREFDIHIDY